MTPHGATLTGIREHCWSRLATAPGTPGDAMRSGVFTTRLGEGVASRTVVIRTVDATRRLVTFNTDYRTAKASELAQHPHIAWLFYDPQAGTQIRLRGQGKIVRDPVQTEPHWQSLPAGSYRSFLTTRAPSTAVDEWTIDVSEHLLVPEPVFNDADIAQARSNFAVVETTIDHVDWVWLAPDGTVRNARAQFSWNGTSWDQTWVVP